ncbi:MAG TPA: leucyl/phenylalanyl-tRNA--protein transferase [Patescibacteria group bacterium]|nr:leucyl/phenylalanyl-tRNA--protein transferase [Patescibacteria group bacterium]
MKKTVPILDSGLWFPDPQNASPEGLVAIGGDLSVNRLLLAYGRGIFPWTVSPLTWWSPDPRGIFDLNSFHVSRSLGRTVRKGAFQITRNQAFRDVIEGCARPGPERPTTWISPQFIDAYTELHLQGYAHSVECWRAGQLAGGIYGVAIGGLFAGESMFHRVSDASKIALYYLVEHLKERQFGLFDIQMVTPITAKLGAMSISRTVYLEKLAAALEMHCSF